MLFFQNHTKLDYYERHHYVNVLKLATEMTFTGKSILNTNCHFIDVGVKLLSTKKRKRGKQSNERTLMNQSCSLTSTANAAIRENL